MVLEKDYSRLPPQNAHKVRVRDSPVYPVEAEMAVHPAIQTNDISVNWVTGEPGDTIPWHSHPPDMYQILSVVEGRCVWRFRDNDGDEQAIEGGPGEVVFLPPGAENMVEVVGSDSHLHISATKRSRLGRLERLLGESTPTGPSAALVYDDMNGRVVRTGDGFVE